ncbi:MAG: alkaline phytoceramidase [Polyangia bacterium]
MSLLDRSATTRLLIAAAPVAVLGGVFLLLPRFPQSERYHRFADRRRRFGLPSFNDVVSNAAFVLPGAFGLWQLARPEGAVLDRREAAPWAALFASAIGIGAGSAYYHLRPDHTRLVWDRLPMSTAFMAAIDVVLTERVSAKYGPRALGPMMALGAGSVLAWYASERAGKGDLRLYSFVQAAPFAALPLLLGLFPSRYTQNTDWALAIASYGAAKLCELLDRPLYKATGRRLSGHTLKHLFAGVGFAVLSNMLRKAERTRAKDRAQQGISAEIPEAAPTTDSVA